MGIDDCFELGNVIRTHGLQGGLVFFLDTDSSTYYKNLESIFIEIDGKLIPFFIQSIQINGQQAIARVEDVEDIDAASQLVGKSIYLPLDKLPELESGQFYYHDLIGFEVYNGATFIGNVTNVYQVPNNHLLSVDHQGTEVLVPINDEIIREVDLQAKKIIALLPEGLIDVYLDQ